VAEVTKLVRHQPARKAGYRVNVDAVHLAEFASPNRRVRRAVDLGAGVGAVGLFLLDRDRVEHVTFVEIDATLATFAARNVEDNGWAHRASVVQGDVASFTEQVDLVVCNPPYVAPGRGRSPAPSLARAKRGPLTVFLDAARRCAGRRARVCFVYPAIESTTLMTELRKRGLEPKRLRFVHARASQPARVVLVEACAAKPGGLVVEPPLIEISRPA